MEPAFWQERWQLNQIGFHEPSVHPLLERHWRAVAGTASGAVLVPLCGKSVDMQWLAQRGHSVVGSELSEIAVRDFLAGRTASITSQGSLKCFADGAFRLWCGDFFALSDQHEPPLPLAYDRAALIALPEPMRMRYAAHLLSRLAPGARLLLITLQHSAADLKGPPFCVTHRELERLFGKTCEIEHLEQAPTRVKGRFDAIETASCLEKRVV